MPRACDAQLYTSRDPLYTFQRCPGDLYNSASWTQSKPECFQTIHHPRPYHLINIELTSNHLISPSINPKIQQPCTIHKSLASTQPARLSTQNILQTQAMISSPQPPLWPPTTNHPPTANPKAVGHSHSPQKDVRYIEHASHRASEWALE